MLLNGDAFTAITRVQIPSGTPIKIRDLRRLPRFCVGTGGHKNAPQPELRSERNTVFLHLFVRFPWAQMGTNLCRRMLFLSCPPADQEPHDLRLSPSFLVADRLKVPVRPHPPGDMAT